MYYNLRCVFTFVCPFLFINILFVSFLILQQDVPLICRQCIVGLSSCLFIMDLLSTHCHKNHNGKAMDNKERRNYIKISLFRCKPWAVKKSSSNCCSKTKTKEGRNYDIESFKHSSNFKNLFTSLAFGCLGHLNNILAGDFFMCSRIAPPNELSDVQIKNDIPEHTRLIKNIFEISICTFLIWNVRFR